MKVSFADVYVPPEPVIGPLPVFKPLEGKELEEVHERMRQWLREHPEGLPRNYLDTGVTDEEKPSRGRFGYGTHLAPDNDTTV